MNNFALPMPFISNLISLYYNHPQQPHNFLNVVYVLPANIIGVDKGAQEIFVKDCYLQLKRFQDGHWSAKR